MDNFGRRLRALLFPPDTGSYQFGIASDDASVLYLSPSTNPAQAAPVARVNGWTNFRQFTKETNQMSAVVQLTNGQPCYIEAVMKEGTGGDNLTVMWVRPGSVTNIPIPGQFLRPVGMAPPVITAHPPPSVVLMENDITLLRVEVARRLNVGYRWQINGTNAPAGGDAEFVYGPAARFNHNDQIRAIVTNLHGPVTSQVAAINVVPDTVPPTVSAAAMFDGTRVEVMFSEPVEAATATNPTSYTVPGGPAVTAARLSSDGRSVLLTLASPVTTGVTVRVTGVRDRASMPNTIVTDTPATAGARLGPPPLAIWRGVRESAGPSSRRTPLGITELHYHPAPRGDGRETEFIEIYNSVEWPWDLGGYRLSGEVSYLFPPGTVVSGRSYVVVAAAPADLQAVHGLSNVLGPYSGRLGNGGGEVRLVGRLGEVLLELEYDDEPPWPAAPDGGGPSLILARPSYGERDPRAWAAGTVDGGTPGGPDPWTSHAWSTVVINEWLAHTDDPQEDFIELFNAGTQAVSLAGCWLSDDAATNKFRIPDGEVIPAGGHRAWTQSQLGFALDAAGEVIFLRAGRSHRDRRRGLRALGQRRFQRADPRWRCRLERGRCAHTRRPQHPAPSRPHRHQRDHVPPYHRGSGRRVHRASQLEHAGRIASRLADPRRHFVQPVCGGLAPAGRPSRDRGRCRPSTQPLSVADGDQLFRQFFRQPL